jgi:hypothetical protein
MSVLYGPKWILLDAVDICEDLDIHVTLLEYYDMRSSQWITCSLSYPHDIKRDGYPWNRTPLPIYAAALRPLGLEHWHNVFH